MSIFRKFSTALKLFSHPETWRVIGDERRHGKRTLMPAPLITEVENDESAGLRKIQVEGQEYWLPCQLDLTGLGEIYREVFHTNHPHYYEFEGCQLQAGDVVVDAGASEGFFTRFALDRGAKVLAIEPYKPLAESLRRTFSAEAAEGRFVVEETCITDREGTSTLHFDPNAPWGAHADSIVRRGESSSEVKFSTLDSVLKRSPWDHCNFLKMDIEGLEREAIAGAIEILRRDRPCLSIAVYHHPTGYLDIRADVLGMKLGYCIRGKGLLRRRAGVWVPMILHAWPQIGLH